ncbi:hypothetical protein Trydic_g6593 [Trypoxylus dichotomus]
MTKRTIFTVSSINGKYNLEDARRNEDSTEATFETAISATGFGKFNYFILVLSIPCGCASMMATTSMSYVAPAAHCDLDLNLQQRGMLNAITYIGMISSALAWGFLADTLGRKKILVVGYLTDAIFVTIAGLAQTYDMLLITKLITGVIMNGPFAALTTAVSEFHSAKYRAKVLMGLGVMYSFAQLIIPALAWSVIPQRMDYKFFDGYLKLHSWNIFILICAVPSIICSIGHSFIPESPKFLMTVGRNDEALLVLKKVYHYNTGLDPKTFPVKSLIDETKLNIGGKHGGLVTANRTKVQALKEGLQQIAPMFFPPYILKIALVATIQSGFMTGANTLRLWLPQIFTAINDYQVLHPNITASLCAMLGIIKPDDSLNSTECVVNHLSDSIYINAMIVSATAVIGYSIAGIAINRIGKKPSIIVLSLISGAAVTSLYFAQNSPTTVALAAINITAIGICCNIELTIVVDTFPTTLRAIAVSITLMIGRCGAMLGNLLFPYLLEIGCLPPFLFIGCVIISCSFLSIFLPKTDMKALE